MAAVGTKISNVREFLDRSKVSQKSRESYLQKIDDIAATAEAAANLVAEEQQIPERSLAERILSSLVSTRDDVPAAMQEKALVSELERIEVAIGAEIRPVQVVEEEETVDETDASVANYLESRLGTPAYHPAIDAFTTVRGPLNLEAAALAAFNARPSIDLYPVIDRLAITFYKKWNDAWFARGSDLAEIYGLAPATHNPMPGVAALIDANVTVAEAAKDVIIASLHPADDNVAVYLNTFTPAYVGAFASTLGQERGPVHVGVAGAGIPRPGVELYPVIDRLAVTFYRECLSHGEVFPLLGGQNNPMPGIATLIDIAVKAAKDDKDIIINNKDDIIKDQTKAISDQAKEIIVRETVLLAKDATIALHANADQELLELRNRYLNLFIRMHEKVIPVKSTDPVRSKYGDTTLPPLSKPSSITPLDKLTTDALSSDPANPNYTLKHEITPITIKISGIIDDDETTQGILGDTIAELYELRKRYLNTFAKLNKTFSFTDLKIDDIDDNDAKKYTSDSLSDGYILKEAVNHSKLLVPGRDGFVDEEKTIDLFFKKQETHNLVTVIFGMFWATLNAYLKNGTKEFSLFTFDAFNESSLYTACFTIFNRCVNNEAVINNADHVALISVRIAKCFSYLLECISYQDGIAIPSIPSSFQTMKSRDLSKQGEHKLSATNKDDNIANSSNVWMVSELRFPFDGSEVGDLDGNIDLISEVKIYGVEEPIPAEHFINTLKMLIYLIPIDTTAKSFDIHQSSTTLPRVNARLLRFKKKTGGARPHGGATEFAAPAAAAGIAAAALFSCVPEAMLAALLVLVVFLILYTINDIWATSLPPACALPWQKNM